MRRSKLTATLVILFLAAAASAAALQIVPTTTLAAETGNNTAASNLFNATSNGDLAPANVSKINTRTLLYPGFNGKVYAHFMGWFCMNAGSTATGAGTNCLGHIQVGYKSADPAVAKAQIEDMISRGIDGVIHDWYGQGTKSDADQLVFTPEAEKHPGFEFAIMIDKGAITSSNATQDVITHAQYIAQTYFPSPNYMRINGRPVITNFGLDTSVDWAAVAAATPGNPIFLFSNSGGFSTQTNPMTSGSYSWVMPGDPNYGLDYLRDFYNAGMMQPSLITVGAMYKGFNDTIASWSKNRIIDQQCGQTWLQTFAVANNMYSGAHQLPAIQIVTWDDYEEGTEIETGIDNCVSVRASVAGTVLSWAISGGESTIDHYQAFISTDGQTLASLADVPVGTRQLDLAGYTLPAGAFKLYIKAVGKPSLRNQMSNPVSLTLAAPTTGGATPGAGKTVSLTASPSTAMMTRGQSAQFQLTVNESGASDPVSLGCSTLPPGMSCSFSPATVIPGASGASAALTVTSSATMAALHSPVPPRRGVPLYAFWMSGMALAGLVTLPEAARRNRRMLLLATLLGLAMLQLACGGGGQSKPTVTTQSDSSATSTYTVTVNATSGATVGSTTLTVTVN